MNSFDRFYKWVESNGHIIEECDDEDTQHLFMQYIQELTNNALESYNVETPKIIERNKMEHDKFLKKHISHWEGALNLLELLIDICISSGSNFSEHRKIESDLAKENKTGLLIRLHAKACSISNEILLLLKNGYADGAHARWRSLHEINVTLQFISSNSPVCAERFLAHEIYDSFHGMKSHKKYEHRLQEKGPTEEEYASITQKFKGALKKYGNNFDSQYGWATPFLPENNRAPGFQSLEKAVELDHMRPYFKWANQNIHSSAKTITRSLTTPSFDTNIINIGPSNFGLTDPAQNTALSLTQATAAILTIVENEENIVIINSLTKLTQTIGRKSLETARIFNTWDSLS